MSMKNLGVGHQVRRAGAPFNTENTGVIVEAVYPPTPSTEGLSVEESATQLGIAQALPAQIKVYWQHTGLVEQLTENDVDGNYPGGNAYRAWDHGFPMFAVETDGHGGVEVWTPDGEQAVAIERSLWASKSDSVWADQIVYAVKRYLSNTIPDKKPAEISNAEQFEDCGV
jgi:hypothetical protein